MCIKNGYNKGFDYDGNIVKIDFDTLLGRECIEIKSKVDGEVRKLEFEPEIYNRFVKIRQHTKDMASYIRRKSLFRKKNKIPDFVVTKKLKAMKQQFVEMIQTKSTNDDEIPDETTIQVNEVRLFECSNNINYRCNTKIIKRPSYQRQFNGSYEYSNLMTLNKSSNSINSVHTEVCKTRILTPVASTKVISRFE